MAMNDTIRNYKDKYGRVVSEKRSLEITNKDLKFQNDSLKTTIKNYKPEVVIITETETVYKDTMIVNYNEPIPFKFEREWHYKDLWLEVNGISNEKGVTITNLATYNKQSIVAGWKRDGFLKPRYASIRIVNENPHMQVVDMQSYIIRDRKKFYETNLFWGALGFVGGVLINK